MPADRSTADQRRTRFRRDPPKTARRTGSAEQERQPFLPPAPDEIAVCSHVFRRRIHHEVLQAAQNVFLGGADPRAVGHGRRLRGQCVDNRRAFRAAVRQVPPDGGLRVQRDAHILLPSGVRTAPHRQHPTDLETFKKAAGCSANTPSGRSKSIANP